MGSWFSLEIKGDCGISLEQNRMLQATEIELGQDGGCSFLRISFSCFNTCKFEPRGFGYEKLHNHIPKCVFLGPRHFYVPDLCTGVYIALYCMASCRTYVACL